VEALIVRSRFPDEWATICRLMEESDAFRDACADYERSVLARDAQREAGRPEAAEYETVVIELEAELLRFLREEESDPRFLAESEALAAVARYRKVGS
jgi:hypothetical protein